MRTDNLAIVAGSYLRTEGDPVRASRECYRRLLEQTPSGSTPSIICLGVTGSGRQIAGLHALTDGVVNEIVAHAAAAVHFDPEVETIFEIGGQDAKYTWITNRVASDYAMNEACSAGNRLLPRRGLPGISRDRHPADSRFSPEGRASP